jgi:hypothetical protein
MHRRLMPDDPGGCAPPYICTGGEDGYDPIGKYPAWITVSVEQSLASREVGEEPWERPPQVIGSTGKKI